MKRIPLPQIDNCDNCGTCCTGQEALPVSWYISGLGGDLARLPAELLAELRSLAERFDRENSWPSNGEACVWYDAETKRCRHYEHRPELCRDSLQPGDEDCRRIRKQKGIDPFTTYRIHGGRLIPVVTINRS